MELPIFCINLASAREKSDRMRHRLARAGFTNVTFVAAANYDSPLVSYYTNRYNVQTRKDIGCFASHLLAIRLLLATGAPGGLICEDDVLFHNDFGRLWTHLYAVLPENIPLCTLGWMLTGDIDQTYYYRTSYSAPATTWTKPTTAKVHEWEDDPTKWTGPAVVESDPIYFGLWAIDSKHTWDTQCYYISAEYAQRIIGFYDHPIDQLLRRNPLAAKMMDEHKKITSEIIIRESGGAMASLPLVIEDGISSCRAPHDLPFHARYFCRWGWDNYSVGDPEVESPLAKLSPDQSWPKFPFSK